MKSLSFIFLIFLSLFLVTSCKKRSVAVITATPIDSVAAYKIIITGLWKMPQHTVPAGNHFTKFVGMVHTDSSHIFVLGTLASVGVKNVAEEGKIAVLQNEIANYISTSKALNTFYVTLPNITGTDSAIINLTSKNSLISFESMIAPSPDWFVGIDSYNLIQRNKWVIDTTLNVPGYDAGTEDGDVFGYNNPVTSPQQNISLLTPANASVIANGNTDMAPFISVRFIKQ